MSAAVTDFIQRWRVSGGSEQANAQLFLTELCQVLDLPVPAPAVDVNEENFYCFERKVYLPRGDGTAGDLKRLDLYRKGCFVLEAKQGKSAPAALPLPGLTASSAAKRGTRQWEETMLRGKNQAENYIRSLPAREGRPPFLLVVDVGHCFDIYAEFTCTGGVYLPFPDARNSRIPLSGLEKPEVREMFRAFWLDPHSLDPARRSARVTEEVAAHLAELARLLENDGHAPGKVAQFLMRCIFTMFAEDVSLIPGGSFTNTLQRAVIDPAGYEPYLRDIWTAMNKGAFSVVLARKLLRFNGNIFANPEVLPLAPPQIGILLQAARADWKEVEPAIFGTLLERALNPRERHKLGAHYTPRAYVERLVLPTIMQPLRAEWDAARTAASLLAQQGKNAEALETLRAFHKRLRALRVLDPACGSGNFLYVSLEHVKRLEGEVLRTLTSYGDDQHTLLEVDPQQFLGLEINPRAAHIAEMVLWIGYLQWHFRTHGHVPPPEPVIKKFDNIQCRDALLSWTAKKPAVDKSGKVLSRWNGEAYKTDPVTGRQVPDESVVVVDEIYEGVRTAEWPKADFIIGNPPFIGGKYKRQDLGYGYFDALTSTYGALPESCDFVMYWWHKAAESVRAKKTVRFGFITTNSITQAFNRRVVSMHLDAVQPLHLAFAVPDHPWVDASDGAAVRIAMTVGAKGDREGVLCLITNESKTDARERQVTLAEHTGIINADLTQGTDVTGVKPLKANEGISCQGMKLHGKGFIVTRQEAQTLGLKRLKNLERYIRPFRNGKDLTDSPRDLMVMDFFGMPIDELRHAYPDAYQWLLTHVKPERDQNNRATYRENWWFFGEPRKDFRPALSRLIRYIATPMTAKHRMFIFLDINILPDQSLVAIATDDPFHLGILSSRVHVCWTLNTGGTLEDRPRYNNSVCFAPFPFPAATPEQQARIRDLGEKLDGHRKARQALHPDLTMTGMYNVLEALREGRALTAKEKSIHEQGLVTVLREMHDDLDAAVANAYGWPLDLPDEEILQRLVALNAERTAEEKQGKIRWLRPEYQTRPKAGRKMEQAELDIDLPVAAAPVKGKKAAAKAGPKSAWPAGLPDQTQAVRAVAALLQSNGAPLTADAVAARFTRAPRARVQEILQALAVLGFVTLPEAADG